MPLLKRGPEIFPPDLFTLPEDAFPWVVAQTRSRQEKALVRHLGPLTVPFYVPQLEKRTRRSGRQFVSYLPLFPGYLFFRGRSAERAAVLRSGLVVRLIDAADQAAISRELHEIRLLQQAGASLTPLPRVEVGDAVKVTGGPFAGYHGVVLREPGRVRLIVSLSILRRSIAVAFDRADVSPLPRDTGIDRSAVA